MDRWGGATRKKKRDTAAFCYAHGSRLLSKVVELRQTLRDLEQIYDKAVVEVTTGERNHPPGEYQWAQASPSFFFVVVASWSNIVIPALHPTYHSTDPVLSTSQNVCAS